MKQYGLSLPELLIGLLLSSIIMAGLLHVYLICKKQYQAYQTALEEALDLQWISQLLVHSVRQAGFTPCMRMHLLKLEDRRANRGARARSPQAVRIETVPESALTVQYMDSHVEQSIEQFPKAIKSSATQIMVTGKKSLSAQYPLFLTDCVQGEIHEIADIVHTSQGQQITLREPLLFDYPHGFSAGALVEEKWFIHKDKKSLYYHRGRASELSTAIQSMIIKQQAGTLEIILGLSGEKTWPVVAQLKNA